MKLTEKAIRAETPPEKGRRLIFDEHRDAPRGFGVAVRASGSRSFVLRYKVDGRDRLMKVGDWPTWSLTAARKRAGELKQQTDGGTDPLDAKSERRAAITFKAAVDEFCKRRTDSQASGPAVRRTLERYAVAEFGKRKLYAVRRPEVIELVERVATEHGRQAALLLTYLKQLFRWAEDRGHVQASPIGTVKPKEVAKQLQPVQRKRTLYADELRDLWNRGEAPKGMQFGTLLALRLTLITGQRPGEVARMRWRDLDLEAATWRIPSAHRGKTEDHLTVPLTRAALDLIETARGRGRDGATYVFEPTRGKPIDENAVARAVRETQDTLTNHDVEEEREGHGREYGHWRPHDLRRTAVSGMTATGVSETIALRASGHQKKGMAQVYDRHEYMIEKRRALEAWQARLETIARGEDPDADRAAVHDITEAETA